MLEYFVNSDTKKTQLKDKGYGFVASKPLHKGTIIIKEKPGVYVDSSKSKNDMLEVVYLALTNTNREIIKRFTAMHPHTIDQYVIKYDDIRKEIMKMDTTIKLYLLSIEEDELRLYCAKYMRNAFRFGKYGSSLLLIGSTLNHSCTPNVEFKVDNGYMVFVAATDIKYNEEICINYVPLTDSRQKRHDRLLHQYGFACTCKIK